jgi:hypothetical protein
MTSEGVIFDRPLTEELRLMLERGDIEPENLLGDGPAHPDNETEIRILRWALGYRDGEPDPWTSRSVHAEVKS